MVTRFEDTFAGLLRRRSALALSPGTPADETELASLGLLAMTHEVFAGYPL